MFLSNILILSCMVILDIVEENIFVVISYKFLPSEEKFSWEFIFSSHFLIILHGFNFANWLPLDFWWGSNFRNLSFINVIYIYIYIYIDFFMIYSWASSMWIIELLPKFFKEHCLNKKALFEHDSRLNAEEEINRSRHNKKIFLSMLSLPILFDILQKCLIWLSLIDTEHNVKM